MNEQNDAGSSTFLFRPLEVGATVAIDVLTAGEMIQGAQPSAELAVQDGKRMDLVLVAVPAGEGVTVAHWLKYHGLVIAPRDTAASANKQGPHDG